jgi:hypothetical protein
MGTAWDRLLSKVSQKVENEAAEKAAMKADQEAAVLARRSGAADAFANHDPNNIPRDAQSSAAFFNEQAPNFELGNPNSNPVSAGQSLASKASGDVTTTPSKPNFTMNNPPSGDMPSIKGPGDISAGSASPSMGTAADASGNLPTPYRSMLPDVATGDAGSSVMRDVTPTAERNISPLAIDGKVTPGTGPVMINKLGPEVEQGGMSGLSKLGLATGAAGLAGWALNDDGSQPAAAASKAIQTNPDKGDDSDDEDDDTPVKGKGGTGAKPAGKAVASDASDDDEDTPKGRTLDFGTGKFKDTAAGLEEAQNRQNQLIGAGELGKAGALIGAGFAQVQPSKEALAGYDSQIAQAKDVVPQYLAQMEKQKNEPDSPLSQGMRQFMSSFGFNVTGDATADELMKLSPLAEKYYQQTQQELARKDNLAEKGREFDLRSQDLALRRADLHGKDLDRQDAKLQAATTKRVDTLNKMITAEVASSRSAFGGAAKTLQAVDNVQALLNGETDLNNLDSRQVVEISRVLDRVLSNGSPTISGSEHLTPQAINDRVAKQLEFWTSKRHGANMGDFVASQAATLQREKDQATKQMQNTQRALLGSYSDIKDDPRVQSVLASHGIPEEIWDFSKKPGDKGNSPNTAQVKDFMSKNPGASVQDAISAVAKGGGSPKGTVQADPRDATMVDKYNSMSDGDAQKSVLGNILKKKGLIK